MATSHSGADQSGKVECTITPPVATDALLPTKGEPGKNSDHLSTTLTSRADTMNKVLKKASTLTKRQTSNDGRQGGKLRHLWIRHNY